jgi:hypothetical protein
MGRLIQEIEKSRSDSQFIVCSAFVVLKLLVVAINRLLQHMSAERCGCARHVLYSPFTMLSYDKPVLRRCQHRQLRATAGRIALQQDRVEEVRRLKMMNFNQVEIIHKVWGVRPGDSQTYRDARVEYQQILSQL